MCVRALCNQVCDGKGVARLAAASQDRDDVDLHEQHGACTAS